MFKLIVSAVMACTLFGPGLLGSMGLGSNRLPRSVQLSSFVDAVADRGAQIGISVPSVVRNGISRFAGGVDSVIACGVGCLGSGAVSRWVSNGNIMTLMPTGTGYSPFESTTRALSRNVLDVPFSGGPTLISSARMPGIGELEAAFVSGARRRGTDMIATLSADLRRLTP